MWGSPGGGFALQPPPGTGSGAANKGTGRIRAGVTSAGSIGAPNKEEMLVIRACYSARFGGALLGEKIRILQLGQGCQDPL